MGFIDHEEVESIPQPVHVPVLALEGGLGLGLVDASVGCSRRRSGRVLPGHPRLASLQRGQAPRRARLRTGGASAAPRLSREVTASRLQGRGAQSVEEPTQHRACAMWAPFSAGSPRKKGQSVSASADRRQATRRDVDAPTRADREVPRSTVGDIEATTGGHALCGWQGPWLDPASSKVIHILLLAVVDAPADTLEVRVDENVLWKFDSRPEPADPTRFTERFVRLALNRLAAYGPDRVDEPLAPKMKYPTYVINIEESDRAEVMAPDDKQCRYQLTQSDGDLVCSVGRVPNEGIGGPTTKYLCGQCSLPDTRTVCSHLNHALVLFMPDEAPQAWRAQCDVGQPRARDEPARRPYRTVGHQGWSTTSRRICVS